jgi:hypothetical protein
MITISFDSEDTIGYRLHDFFTGVEFLAGGRTFDEKINNSFCDEALALDWLQKSYKGRDVDGVGILVDGVDL